MDKAEIYTKMLLNIIEYPPEPYEKIVIIVATSEGFLGGGLADIDGHG